MSSKLTVGDVTVAPGEMAFGRLVPGRMAWSQELSVPLIVVNGAGDGPRLWLSAVVHGPEATGTEVIRRVLREALDPKKLRGSIIAVPIANPLYQALLLALAGGFFAGFWYWGGQTLGMRAWRMQVRRHDGAPLAAGQAALRLAALLLALAPAGIGLLWMLVDRDRLPWHDRLAGTRVIVLPKAAR